MSAMWVQIALRKCRSWLMATRMPSYSRRNPSSQRMESRSRLLVGSSRSSACGLAEQRLGEQDAELVPAGDLPHQPGVIGLGNAQTGEQRGGVGLGGVAVLLGDDALEVGEAVPVVVGEIGLVEQRLLLVERGPEPLVALEHHVEDPDVLVGELVLLEDRGLLGPADHAGVRIQLTGQDLHEGRLAGAVGPGEAVALVLAERDVDVLEEALLAVGLGDLGDLQRGHRFRVLGRDGDAAGAGNEEADLRGAGPATATTHTNAAVRRLQGPASPTPQPAPERNPGRPPAASSPRWARGPSRPSSVRARRAVAPASSARGRPRRSA